MGRQFRSPTTDTGSQPYTIVGVVENAKYARMNEDVRRIAYLPASQSSELTTSVTFVVRPAPGAGALAPALHAAISRAQPAALMELTHLSSQIASSLRRERLLAVLSGAFGAIALLLSALGLYGVMAYTVAQRRREIGVRLALGAARARVVRLVLGDVARIVAIGLIAGIGGALMAGRLVQSFLYGFRAADPKVIALAAGTLAIAALAAGWSPAWRASRLDPMESLRDE